MGAAIARHLVFQPPATAASAETIAKAHVDATHAWLETKRGSKIEACFFDRRAATTILFSHANAEDVATVFASAGGDQTPRRLRDALHSRGGAFETHLIRARREAGAFLNISARVWRRSRPRPGSSAETF